MLSSVIRDPGGIDPVRVISSQNVVNGSLLIVPADTVAILAVNGVCSDPYPSGRYEIYPGVHPFFVRFRHLMTGGDPAITCQVFYVNTRYEMYDQGGTGNMIFSEPRYRLSLNAKAAYTLRYAISEPGVFISKLVGMHNNSFCSEDIKPIINSMVLPVVKEAISSEISRSRVNTIQQNLSRLGAEVEGRLRNTLRSYGINLRGFSILAINIPESDIKKLNELEEREAKGRLDTDIEVDNVTRVYGNINNRTRAEMLTGTIRGQGRTVEARAGSTGMAGAIAALPMQIAMARTAMRELNSDLGSSTSTGAERRTPPDLPRRTRTCPSCTRRIDANDAFCRFCGHRF